jgi:hypothetical protein
VVTVPEIMDLVKVLLAGFGGALSKDSATVLLAAYGAALSTWVAFTQRRDKHPRIQSKATYGFLGVGPQLSDQMVLMEIVNVGEMPVTISSGGLMLPNKATLLCGLHSDNSTNALPHELTHGKSLMMWLDLREVKRALSQAGYSSSCKVRAKFTDQASRAYVSRPLKISITE